ncbi:retrovirus-related pol polyprotein from transposon TNT 1-94 [Tanacetum coccineum]|uniref:Retrovirus-related pol polyprotein from transposon TNT 1-94 n=1 Tax=Tanacetum coccineum TaxID=301880 RepID=A0ABQ5AE93_9ASTR
MTVLLDDQMNYVINFLTTKSTWDDLILYHEGPSNVKESMVMDLKLLPKKWLSFCQSLRNSNHVKDFKLASLFGKVKYEENLIDSIYETQKEKFLVSATPLSTAFFSTSIVQDFQDSPEDEKDTRSSHEYLNDLDEEYQARALLAKSKRFFKKGTQMFSSAKATDQTEYHKCGRTEPYEWYEEDVSSDDNEMTKVKVLMTLVEENDAVSKEGARNGEWVKISIRKVHALLEMEDNDDRKTYLDYLCIDLNYVEEQRNNLSTKHRNLVHELNACKEQLLVLKQAKLDFLTMHHVNTEILKENQNLRKELKELTEITKTCLNNSNKVNQCIIEQIPTQKKRILGADQLNEDPSSFWQKGLVFVKYSANDTKVSIPSVERPWLSKAEGFILPNHDTGRILPSESQVITNSNYNIKKKKWLLMSLGKQISQKTYDYADVRAQNQDLLMTIFDLKNKLRTINKEKHVNTKFDKSETLGQLLCVTSFNKNLAIKAKSMSKTKVTSDRPNPVTSQSTSTIEKKQQHNAKCVAVHISVRRPRLRILNRDTVNAINDGLNILCISYGLDVFLHSHDKCVAHHALTRKSSVKRALFTSPVAAKSKGLGATSVVVKSRFSVAKTTTATNKIVDSRCSKHMTGNFQLLRNFFEKFMGIVMLWDWISFSLPITGYGDYVQGNLTICHVYYVKGLGATSTKSWLWHRRLSHLNFGTINQLTSHDLVDGLPKFKYHKNHLCSACEQGKSKKASLPPKLVPSTESKLKLLHMDLCGPMRVASINGKKYILVIVDDYSRYTWVYFLRTKNEAPDMIIDFVNQVQRNLKASILTIRTDNGTEFKNKKLRAFYAKLGIVYKTSIAQTPQQNGVVKRCNRTLVKAARTMLIFSNAPEFLWAEAIATACFTQNHSIIHTRHNKTLYELIRDRKPNV